MLNGRETVCIKEACQQVGVSKRTLYNWMEAGKVQWVQTAGGSRRIFADTLWRQKRDYQMSAVGDDVGKGFEQLVRDLTAGGHQPIIHQDFDYVECQRCHSLWRSFGGVPVPLDTRTRVGACLELVR